MFATAESHPYTVQKIMPQEKSGTVKLGSAHCMRGNVKIPATLNNWSVTTGAGKFPVLVRFPPNKHLPILQPMAERGFAA